MSLLETLTDIARFADLFEKIKASLSAVRHAQIGTEVTIPRIVTVIDGQRWELDSHKARRVK